MSTSGLQRITGRLEWATSFGDVNKRSDMKDISVTMAACRGGKYKGIFCDYVHSFCISTDDYVHSSGVFMCSTWKNKFVVHHLGEKMGNCGRKDRFSSLNGYKKHFYVANDLYVSGNDFFVILHNIKTHFRTTKIHQERYTTNESRSFRHF